MAAQEEPKSTWDKRFKQRHYSYRDQLRTTTSSQPLTAAAISAQTYIFGTNARATNVLGGGGIFNWPNAGDWTLPTPALACYAREVMVHCTTDAWIALVAINPLYLKLLGIGYTAAQITGGLTPVGVAVPRTITEQPQFIPVNSMVTFYPTYGYAIVYWHDSVQGTITIKAEGNVEGAE